MAGLSSASDYAKIILLLQLGSGIIFIIAFGAPYWSTRYDGNSGLWTGCKNGVCYERWNQWVMQWVKVCQTFMVLALIFWFFSTVSVLLYVFHRNLEEDKRMVCLAAILMLTAALCVLMAVLVWGSKSESSYLPDDGRWDLLNWAFGFACATFFAFLIAGILLVKELRRRIK